MAAIRRACLRCRRRATISFCERARASVQRLRYPPLDRVSVSAGVAEMADGEQPEDTIARADARLYEAKRGGRNQVKW